MNKKIMPLLLALCLLLNMISLRDRGTVLLSPSASDRRDGRSCCLTGRAAKNFGTGVDNVVFGGYNTNIPAQFNTTTC